MDTDESCTVPPGFRFHPTDEELVGYYLRKKVASQKIDLDVIRDIDLYRIEPWDLQDKCRIGYEEQNEWYFFSHKDKKYPTGTRTNRATMAGFWKATGRDKAVYDKSKLIGMRKTLVFYKGRAPNGQKTDWIMHEYRLESDENGPPQEEGWVVCRAFKKRITGQAKNMEGWESNYMYEESNHIINNNNNIENYITRSPSSSLLLNTNTFISHQSFLCKQELEPSSSSVENLAFIHSSSSDHLFSQLPQLQSPSLPLLKTTASNPHHHPPPFFHQEEEDQEESGGGNDENNKKNKQVTDWRALDKFVASQLSHDDNNNSNSNNDNDNDNNNNQERFEDHHNHHHRRHHHQTSSYDMGLLNDFLSSGSSECDNIIGICIFDK